MREAPVGDRNTAPVVRAGATLRGHGLAWGGGVRSTGRLARAGVHADRAKLGGARRLWRAGEGIVAAIGDLDRGKPGGLDQAPELSFQESAGDSAGPERDIRLRIIRHGRRDHDVGNLETAARLEHPERLGQHGGLVGAEVDHAVRDHEVDTRVCNGQ